MRNWVVFLISIFACFSAMAEEIYVSDRPLISASFSPDNTLLAVGSADGAVRIGEVKAWKQSLRFLKRQIQRPGEPEYHQISDIIFSPSVEQPLLAVAAVLLTYQGNALLGRWYVIDLWDIKAEKIIWSSDRDALKGPVNELRFLPDGKQLVSADSAGTLAVWNFQNSQPLAQTKFADAVTAVGFLQFNHDTALLVGTANRRIPCRGSMLYAQTLSGTKLDTPFTQRCSVLSMATHVMAHSAFAVGSGENPYLQWYDAHNSSQTLLLHKESVVGVAIINSLQKLVSADDSGVVGIWDLSAVNPKLVKKLVIGQKDKDVGINIIRIAVSQTHFAATHFNGKLTIIPLADMLR